MKRPFGMTYRFGLGVILAATGNVAWGDVVDATYVSPTEYSYRVLHMPDFDQLRLELPNDGNMYCIPTAAANLLAYAANHGFPAQFPGSANWQAQANYGSATFAINVLGNLMETDPVDGTAGNNARKGLDMALALFGGNQASPPLCQLAFFRTPDFDLTLDKLVKQAVSGGIVQFCYGRYPFMQVGQDLIVQDRTPGHGITLTAAAALQPFENMYVEYRDPGDATPADSMQSPFTSRYTEVFNRTIKTSAKDPGYTASTVWWNPSEGSGIVRLIDGFVVVRPTGMLKFAQSGVNFVITSTSLGALSPPLLPVILSGSVYGVVDLAYDADAADALALVSTSPTAGFTQLRRINLLNGEQSPLSTLTSIKRFASERNGCIYAMSSNAVRCLRPDGTVAAINSMIGSPAAIAADDQSHTVIVLDVAQRRLRRLSHDLQEIQTFDIPAAVPLSPDSWVTVNPFDGATYFLTTASNTFFKLGPGWTPEEFDAFSVTGIVTPRNLAAADHGRLFCTEGVGSAASMRMLTLDENDRWVVDPTSPFHQLPGSSRMALMHGRSNFDPAIHPFEQWREATPEEEPPVGIPIPDCVADLTGDGLVGADDLARLLANWGSKPRLESMSVEFDYVGNQSGSWASDMVIVVSDGVHPSVYWGGYNTSLGGEIFGGDWPFYGSGSAPSGTYSATLEVPADAELSGSGPWTVTIGNGWTTSPPVQYLEPIVSPTGSWLPSLVLLPSAELTGGETVSTDFGFTSVVGDLNSDGMVDATDLSMLLSSWGPCSP